MAETRVDAVEAELFRNRLMAIAEEMGELLRRTALSTNIRERLDFSCAVLDSQGRLVVNAPHIPVHLGALGLCVRAVAAALTLRPGDVVVTNHPAYGGSHLPDVTLLTPVYLSSGELQGFVASRAHHAEIGGLLPGSMPANARSLEEEGVVIPPTYLVRSGAARFAAIEARLRGAKYPSRAIEENLADLQAALAANHRGAEALRALCERHGAETVRRYTAILREQARERVEAALRRLGDGRYHAVERLDDGSRLEVSLEIENGSARIDFDGCAPTHPGNLNATAAVATSAVLYVLRVLIDEPLPLNEGLLEPVELRLPEGSLLNPDFPADESRAPAVVGGNVETSQRLVDTLLKALGVVASSQGTMNNVLFGNDEFGYYETIGGGSGAGPDFAGESAVHTHMTNTRITDPEVLEHRFPVRLERFSVRQGSGGDGAFRGGDGALRELVFEEPLSLSVLTQHRVERPYGVAGGGRGAAGRQRLLRQDGTQLELAPVDSVAVSAGDRLIIETPGGGGWGPPRQITATQARES